MAHSTAGQSAIHTNNDCSRRKIAIFPFFIYFAKRLVVQLCRCKPLLLLLRNHICLKRFATKSLKGGTVKEKFKCPWCGTNFRNGRQLDTHAKDHYSKQLSLAFAILCQNP